MHAVLQVPGFRLQSALRLREGIGEDSPLALVDGREKRSVVLERNAEAARHGVAEGMPTPQALARCAGLTVIQRAPDQEDTAHAILLQTAGALSPEVEHTAPGVCTLRLRLPEGHDWHALAAGAVAMLDAQGLKARAGVAPNPDLALLAAGRADPVLVVSEPSAFLNALPVSALEPPPDLLAVLGDWGIHSLRQLCSLPRADLMDRLGPAAVRLWELAAGQTSRPLLTVAPPEEFVESFDFEYEVETTAPLLFLLRRLLDQLTGRIRALWRVAGSMRLTLRLENETEHDRRFIIPEPTASPEVLFRVLDTHLESLTLPWRPVGLSLSLEPSAGSRHQLQLFESALRDPNRFGETLARLAALTGTDRAGMIQRRDTHLPDSWVLTAPRFHQPAPAAGKGETAPAPLPVGLPLRRCRPPKPAMVTLRHHRPAHVECAEGRGPVAEALGPFRLSGRWWEGGGWEREEWDVALENGALLRLSSGPDGWALEGCYESTAPPVPAGGRGKEGTP